jgi:hypothetical protein
MQAIGQTLVLNQGQTSKEYGIQPIQQRLNQRQKMQQISPVIDAMDVLILRRCGYNLPFRTSGLRFYVLVTRMPADGKVCYRAW